MPAPGYEVLEGYVGLRTLCLFSPAGYLSSVYGLGLLGWQPRGIANDGVSVGIRYQGDSGFGALPEVRDWCLDDGVALDEAWFG